MGALIEAAHTRHPVRVEEEVGAVRRAAGRLAAGLPGVRPGDAELVATELATNLVRHAGGGYILLRPAGGGVELLAVDHGPGLRAAGLPAPASGLSVPPARPAPPRFAGVPVSPAVPAPPGSPLAGAPGRGGLGLGLAGVRRAASVFDWHSSPAGTVILAHVGPRGSAAEGFRWGAVNVPLGGAGPSGDGWAVAAPGPAAAGPGGLAVVVVDGLGHGPAAHAAASAALASFARRPAADPAGTVLRAHEAMLGTRGGVLGAAVIDPAGGQVAFAGVGNIAARVVDPRASHTLVSREGTLGTHAAAPAARVQRGGWGPGAVLVMCSDGVSSHWDAAAYPGLLGRDPAVVAAVLQRDHGRPGDDATVVVVADARGGRA